MYTDTEQVTFDKLNKLMDFDHVIRVFEDGTFTDDTPGVHSPSITMITDADDQDIYGDSYLQEQADANGGWELLQGYTGQYSYNGPVMHPSEFVGAGLARDILETPGYYVTVIIEVEDEDGEQDDVPAGWAIAYKEF